MLKEGRAKTIIMSHIETKDIDKPTLKPVFVYITSTHPEYHIEFAEDMDALKEKLSGLNEGGFILLENIRNYGGEKTNSAELAKTFRDISDAYINDAFAVSHREHMSVSALPSLYDAEHKMFGMQMQKEIDNLSKILHPEKPFVVILSGAKFSTKLPLIEKYLKSADRLLIGGALFNNVVKSLGYNVGKSLVDNEAVFVNEMVRTEDFKNKVFVPEQVVVKNIDTGEVRVSGIQDIKDDESILDISEESVNQFSALIQDAKTIVWNGPLGNYEDDAFKKGTLTLAKELVDLVHANTDTRLFIGGGDTVAAVNTMNIQNERIFVSTGGGAMLEFLEKDGKLPGVVSMR
jgi:phosphoglycerate kinase